MSQPPYAGPGTAPHVALVVVLGGGGSRRLGHDKLAASIGDRSLLDTLLAGLAEALPDVPVAVVGPERATRLPVTWCREEPAGGGPVAGLAAALGLTAGLAPPDDPRAVMAVVAGDQPFAAPALPLLVAALVAAAQVAALDGPDGVIGVDASGRDQPLLAAYRAGPLRRAVGAQPAGRSMRSVVSQLSVVRLPLEQRWCLDVDTAADLDAARRAARLGSQP